MFYHLAMALERHFSALNVFSYHTVRAGAAAVTAFAICLLIGPRVILWLRMLKVGQYIRKEHVADLHALHQGKAGTPTMGGMLIILGTLITCILWGRLSNRLLILALLVLLVLGTLGFIDDYVKLRRKHNQGLTARAKFIGQILTGLLLGLYLVYNPITVSATNIAEADVTDWPGFVEELTPPHRAPVPEGKARVWAALPEGLQARLAAAVEAEEVPAELRADILGALNGIIVKGELYDEQAWDRARLNGEGRRLVENAGSLAPMEQARLNRMLVESAFPEHVVRSVRNLHTKVAIPYFKNLYLPLGALLYVLFTVVLIVSSSNAVNLTDGLDGLAIGASIISMLVYTGIAYVISRVDWSNYLFLTYVPEASELTVFGAAMLGSGLAFLWYNSHPAEVFMGDTGSLALGGAIGTMALLTKQELLLILVGGLFVMEAGSVVLQVASFKLRGKRIFRMAPLHHHFELKGWSESKVTIRFWILAIIFALMSLGTLKLR
jgi:phospho-N-acetylmuramoyl-pentapeptide-transferase